MPRLNSQDGLVFVGGAGLVVLDLGVNGNRMDLDADNDTSIRASADDVIIIEIAAADDFTLRANALDVETGSKIAHNAAVASYLSFIIDVNDNELLDTQAVASAVNQVGISNSATGNPVIVEALGGDANIPILLQAKGTGQVRIPNASEGLRLGTVNAYATTQGTDVLTLFQGTAPAGAITTSVGLFTDGTSMRKIIAAGTVSNVET